jgi:hypothetical protein
MTHFNLLQNRLSAIHTQWNSFNDETKKQKINFILPFIQLASYLNSLEPASNDALLHDFAATYQRLYDQDISQMNASDLSPDLFAQITSQKLSAAGKADLLKYQDKYIHAHNRVMFNYGRFLNQSREFLAADQQQEIARKTSFLKEESADEAKEGSAQAAQSIEQFVQLLSAINHDFGIEKHSAGILKDDLENHALLNQMTNYALNISQTANTLLDEKLFAQTQEIMISSTHKLQVKRTSATSDLSGFTAALAQYGIEMTVGLENEFLLNPLDEKSTTQNPTQRNIATKKVLADINARRKMQIKYGFESTLPEISDVSPFLENGADFNEGIGLSDFKKITDDLERRLSKKLSPALKERVASFTEAESFFYKLFFLENFAAENKIEMDGIFDPTKSTEENFVKTLPLIENGRFHENLLDMIQAHEIAVGPFDVAEIITKKDLAFAKMKLLANQSGVSLDDANVQINSAFTIEIDGEKKNILLPKISSESGETTIEFNELGRQFLQLLEEAVAELGAVPGALRQSAVNASFDRNKFVAPQLKGTAFRAVNEELPAFLNHKFLAAKNSPLRLSLINSDLAVVELRLVGNNPHFAKFRDAQNTFHSGAEFITEEFLPRVAQKLENFLANKSKAELEELYNAKITIGFDGKIAGLAETAAAKVELDRDYDLSTQERYNPRAPSLSVALIPYNAPQPSSAAALLEQSRELQP